MTTLYRIRIRIRIIVRHRYMSYIIGCHLVTIVIGILKSRGVDQIGKLFWLLADVTRNVQHLLTHKILITSTNKGLTFVYIIFSDR